VRLAVSAATIPKAHKFICFIKFTEPNEIISGLLSKVTHRQPTRQNSDIYNDTFEKNTKILPVLKWIPT
jgi:hypothetical protein